jgi:signal transduction histidine kinase
MTELALETDLTSEQREYIENVKLSAESLLVVINDLLDFSKIEAGKLTIEAIDFPLRATVADALKPLAARARATGLALDCEIAPDVPDAVVGDPTRLRQILVNLVGNAVKFTEEGRIDVRATATIGDERGEADSAHFTLHVAVHDTGIGIPLDRQHVIFESFAQADGATTRRFGGTGLGLAISKRLVEMMGGTICFESEPGRGTTFRFDLPFAQSIAAAQAAAKVEGDDAAGAHDEPTFEHPLRVLLAEDHPINQRLVTGILEKRGHAVVVAGKGEVDL